MKSENDNYEHTRQRAKERYGVDLSLDTYKSMNAMIVFGAARRIQSPDDDKEAYVVVVDGARMAAVFNPLTARVETVLPAKVLA